MTAPLDPMPSKWTRQNRKTSKDYSCKIRMDDDKTTSYYDINIILILEVYIKIVEYKYISSKLVRDPSTSHHGAIEL